MPNEKNRQDCCYQREPQLLPEYDMQMILAGSPSAGDCDRAPIQADMSLQDVVAALQASTSADHQTRTLAESRLKELADLHPSFYEALLEVVALADQAPLEVRIQAILFFKNALDRWRKTCPKSVPLRLALPLHLRWKAHPSSFHKTARYHKKSRLPFDRGS